ncbi:MAG: DUF6308 family protein [Acidimicrobiia bacterium]
MTLTFGSGGLVRVVRDPVTLLIAYRGDSGTDYLNFRPTTPVDVLLPEDLAVTILINSRVGPRAFQAVQSRAHELDMPRLTRLPLEESTERDRDGIADAVAQMAAWPGFAASVATKVLHKKRPATIPILDNQAIFGAYMNPTWPDRPSSTESVYSRTRIREALEWIWRDLTASENQAGWAHLLTIEPARSRVELFDMVWWMHFRSLEPVKV